MRLMTLIGAAFTAAVIAGSAGAVPVTCPVSPTPDERVFTLDTTPGSTCLGHGTGNISGNPADDPIFGLLPNLVLIDKSDNGGGALDGALVATAGSLTGGLSGSFSFSAPGFTNFVIGFKSGFGRIIPVWAAFLLPAGVFSGDWSISGTQALSHANLYGVQGPTPIPLPGAAILLIGGLGALGALAARRKKPA